MAIRRLASVFLNAVYFLQQEHRRRIAVEYNLHQENVWSELGSTVGTYINILSKVRTNPWSYIIIPTALPLNSQKPEYRKKLIEGINSTLDGDCSSKNYQISNWGPFTWRYKIQVDSAHTEGQRTCFLYGDNVHRRILFGDVPKEAPNKIEQVLMNEVFSLPIENNTDEQYVDALSCCLMEPLAAETITIDRLHRYADNRIRFDLVFDDIRYRLVCAVKEIGDKKMFTELTLFFED